MMPFTLENRFKSQKNFFVEMKIKILENSHALLITVYNDNNKK